MFIAFDLHNCNSFILESDIAVKWNLWVGKNKSWKEGTVLILSQKRIYFHWWYDDPIFSFPKYHSLSSEAAYSLIFSASLSCFLLEIVFLKADVFLIVVWFPTFYIIKNYACLDNGISQLSHSNVNKNAKRKSL